MSIRTRIFLLTALPVILLAGLTGFSTMTMHMVRDESRNLIENVYVDIIQNDVVGLLEQRLQPFFRDDMSPMIQKELPHQNALIDAVQALLNADRDAYQTQQAETRLILMPENQEGFLADHAENLGQVETRIRAVKPLLNSEGVRLFEQVLPPLEAWKERTQTIADLIRGNQPEEAARLSVDAESIHLFNAFRSSLDVLVGHLEVLIETSIQQIESRSQSIAEQQVAMQTLQADIMGRMEASKETLHAMENRNGRQILIFQVVCAVLVLALLAMGFFIARSILRPIQKAVKFAQTIGKGDLSERMRMDSRDEMGVLSRALDVMADGLEAKGRVAAYIADGDLTRDVTLLSDRDTLGLAFAQMAENLRGLLSTVDSVSNHVAAGSEELSHASDDLARGATEQAASVEEISASMVEIGAQAKANAINSKKASDAAESVRKMGEDGSRQMNEMLQSMANIDSSSQEIAKIIKVIDEIAFQTNLLALNAAVEAARAGQHGKGFAVVAEEVRNLASRSTRAAKETTELIEDSLKKVSEGTQTVNGTSQSLSKIIEGTGDVATLVADISSASAEQERGVEQINVALNQVDNVTQRMSASTEEMSSAARTLNEQAMNLQGLMDQFRMVEEAPNPSNSRLPLVSSLPNGGGMNLASL